MKNHRISFDKVYTKTIDLLEGQNMTYFVIGGLAAGVLGEARMTRDVDILIKIGKQDISRFLKAARVKGFKFNLKEVIKTIEVQGFFKLSIGDFRVDFILGSMPFEIEAFKRRYKIKVYNRYAFFPTPEDLILFKIIAGREKDMLDAKSIAIRHKCHLDINYLKKWAQIISDDLENIKVYRRLEETLKETI